MKKKNYFALILALLATPVIASTEIKLPDGSMATVVKSKGKSVTLVSGMKVAERGVTSIEETSDFEGKTWLKKQDGSCMVVDQRIEITDGPTLGNVKIQLPILHREFGPSECPSWW